MPYPFLTALTDLDSRVQAAEAQLERLYAALQFDEQSLLAILQDASVHATALADLIRAERPQAQWNDRPSLDSLLEQLELDAEAKRREQRCARLLDLADELQAGQVRHRFEARTTVLNKLRLEAVQELRAKAGVPLQAKELPGPGVSEWLNWAFNLKDDEDATAIAQLREDFGALERFAGEMEDIYWLPGRTARTVVADTAAAKPASAEFSAAVSAPGNGRPRSGKAEDGVAGVMAGAYAEQGHTATQPVAPETRERADVASRERSATATLPAQDVVEENASTAALPTAMAAPAAERPSPSEAPAQLPQETFDTAPAPAALADSEDAREPAADDSDGEVVPRRKWPVIAWAAPAGFLVLSALFFAVLHHLHARNDGKPASTVQAATAGAAPGSLGADLTPESEPAVPDPAVGNTAGPTAAGATKPNLPMLHRQPAEGAQDSIALSLEQCDRGTPDHVECWGYVSNVGGANSRVSLDRVDVVDGRGNSFSLDRNGQFAFPSGRSSNVAPGDKVRFTVKVPDKDADARTLTLYMDLSNPRNLEYTFRDVPIAR